MNATAELTSFTDWPFTQETYQQICDAFSDVQIRNASFQPNLDEILFDIQIDSLSKIGPFPSGVYIRSISPSTEVDATHVVSIDTRKAGNEAKTHHELTAYLTAQLSLFNDVEHISHEEKSVAVEVDDIQSTSLFRALESSLAVSINSATLSKHAIHSLTYQTRPDAKLTSQTIQHIQSNKLQRKEFERANNANTSFECSHEVTLKHILTGNLTLDAKETPLTEKAGMKFYKISQQDADSGFIRDTNTPPEDPSASRVGYVCKNGEHAYIPTDSQAFHSYLLPKVEVERRVIQVSGEPYTFVLISTPYLPNNY